MGPGTFDPALFLDATTTEAMDTQFVPIPEGEYLGVAEEPKISEWKSKDGTMSGLKVTIPWNLDDANLKTLLGRDKVLIRQDIMLDLNPGGGLDTGKGKNVYLGKLRDALNLNQKGQPFNFRMITGRMGKIMVKNRVHPEDAERILNDVKGVAKAM